MSARVHRLLRPAAVVVGFVGIGLALLAVAGVSADIVALTGFRYAQPLWFLGVFLLCQALLPALSSLHERAPLWTITVLSVASLVVDTLRAMTGIDGIGFLNLAFVWLTLQQLGFFLADGTVDALSRRTRAAVGASVCALLGLTFLNGVYSPDLIANLNPPTGALLLVGVVHLSLFSLLRERIARFSIRPRVVAISAFVNRRTMTIYLWHMPVLLAMAGFCALVALNFGFVLPEPSSALWWLGCPLWLAVALVLTALTAVLMSRFEDKPAPALSIDLRRIIAAVAVGIASVALLLVVGMNPLTAVLSVVVMLLALRLASNAWTT